MSQLGKADLHIHLEKIKPGELLEYVQNKTDLDVIAITGHDSICEAQKVRAAAQHKKYRFEIIIGEEVSTQEGHIVGLFLKKNIPAGLTTHETLKKIKEQEGIAIAVHPFLSSPWHHPKFVSINGVGDKILLAERENIDAIEIANANHGLGKKDNKAYKFSKSIFLKAEIGSSDAHILEVIGKAYTLFPGKTAQDLKQAILSRQTRAVDNKKWNLRVLFKYILFLSPALLMILFYTLSCSKKKKTVK